MPKSGIVAVLALALGLSSPYTAARELLRILTWPGYADQDLVQEFEKRFDVDVEVTMVASDDELWSRLSANRGGNFDVFAANTAELQRYINSGISVPLNLQNIPNTRNQTPRFRKLADIPGLVHDDKVYAIPYTFSEMGLIYNRKLVKRAPDSMTAMWDPQYRGQVLIFNGSAHNFSLTALTLGIRNPFQLDDRQFSETLQRLRLLRRNIQGMYNRPEEAVELFREHPIALIYGNYGTQQLQLLRKAGADVGYVIPREGALAWLDCWGVSAGAKNRALAEAWINYTLTPAVSGQLPSRQGLANTIDSKSSTTTSDNDRLVWLQPVENFEKRAQFWERIRAGYQNRKF